jgi:hypothetical protein
VVHWASQTANRVCDFLTRLPRQPRVPQGAPGLMWSLETRHKRPLQPSCFLQIAEEWSNKNNQATARSAPRSLGSPGAGATPQTAITSAPGHSGKNHTLPHPSTGLVWVEIGEGRVVGHGAPRGSNQLKIVQRVDRFVSQFPRRPLPLLMGCAYQPKKRTDVANTAWNNNSQTTATAFATAVSATSLRLKIHIVRNTNKIRNPPNGVGLKKLCGRSSRFFLVWVPSEVFWNKWSLTLWQVGSKILAGPPAVWG